MQIGENPIVITILTATISGLISFCIGYFLYKSKVDIDALQVHFKELKEDIIRPMLNILESTPGDMPSQQQIAQKPFNMYKIDSELCQDLMDNHYPQITSIWDSFIAVNGLTKEKYRQAEVTFNKKIKETLDQFKIKYADEDDKSSKTNINVVFLDIFASRLINLILIERRYHENEFELLRGDTTIDLTKQDSSIVFYNPDTTECRKTFDNLKKVGNILNSDAGISEIVESYSNLAMKQDKTLRDFKRILNIVLRKTSINLQKEKVFRIRCKFIRPKLILDN